MPFMYSVKGSTFNFNNITEYGLDSEVAKTLGLGNWMVKNVTIGEGFLQKGWIV